jgi:hypothetical protein
MDRSVTVEKAEIAALLEALCDRPLADGQSDAADLQAFFREAAKTLSRSKEAEELASTADLNRLTSALATLLSGEDSESARRTIVDAVLRSDMTRLDVQSAIAFVDGVEQSPQPAPSALVDALLAADRVTASAATRSRVGGAWSRLMAASWSPHRWRMVGACVIVIAVGTGSWWAFQPQTHPDMRGASPTGKMPPLVDAPASAGPTTKPVLPAAATIRPCEPGTKGARVGVAETADGDNKLVPGAVPPDPICERDNQAADRPNALHELMLARERAAAEAAAKAGAADVSRVTDHEGSPTAEPGLSARDPVRHPPAAVSRPAPAAASPVR